MKVHVTHPTYPRVLRLTTNRLATQTTPDASTIKIVSHEVVVAASEFKRLSQGNRKSRRAAAALGRKIERDLPPGVGAADIAYFL